jgi:hypothetical protein
MLMHNPPSPATPLSTHKYNLSSSPYSVYKPTNSSPLAATNSSPGSSPIAAVQARRRSQYKAQPTASSSHSGSGKGRVVVGDDSDDSQKAFLRTRLKLRCIERASQARERAVKKKRALYMSSSDDMDVGMDYEDEAGDNDDPIFDEVRLYATHPLHRADRALSSSPVSCATPPPKRNTPISTRTTAKSGHRSTPCWRTHATGRRS